MATTVLITGAGGLIGSLLVEQWSDPAYRLVPVRSADIDLLVPGAAARLVDSARPDRVVHLAWCASGTPGYRRSDDNARWLAASLELHEACLETGALLWATGTVVDRERAPADAYAAAKSQLRRQLADVIETGAIGWLRPYYVFDEAAGTPAVVALALAARRNSAPVELQTPGSSHDFVHAYDVARAVEAAVTHQLTGEVPIGSGSPHSVSDLVDALGVGWKPTPDADTSTTHVDEVADITRLRNTGWTPTKTEEFFAHD